MKKLSLLIAIITFMIFLLTMPEITNYGAIAAINLCLYSVIPALFPYILITNYILSNNLYDTISSFFYPLIGKTFKISKYGSFVIVMGLLCGYPMGAKILGELITTKKISYSESCYLITFCNNCSISFIINYIFFNCLHANLNLYKLLILIYLPIFITAIVNRIFFKIEQHNCNVTIHIPKTNPILNAVKTMSSLCSYVFLFTIIAYFIKYLIPLDKKYLYPIISLIEITSGASLLSQLNWSHILLVLCVTVLFGGLSTMFQTFSLIPLKIRKFYIMGKIQQILFAIIIYFCIN